MPLNGSAVICTCTSSSICKVAELYSAALPGTEYQGCCVQAGRCSPRRPPDQAQHAAACRPGTALPVACQASAQQQPCQPCSCPQVCADTKQAVLQHLSCLLISPIWLCGIADSMCNEAVDTAACIVHQSPTSGALCRYVTQPSAALLHLTLPPSLHMLSRNFSVCCAAGT